MKKFVAVAGNIGAGKSTLVQLLCERLTWEPYYEPVAENPYLEDFYRDMQTWAFHSQVFFITHRLRSHKQLLSHPTSVVQDRTVYEDAEIFARNLYLQGNIGERDYKTYRNLYHLLVEMLHPPDLVVYLRASVPTLQHRIAQRGRDFESRIPADYLERLNLLYEEWIATFSLCPVLTIPSDDINFVDVPAHLDLVVRKVQDKLTGNEEVTFLPEEIQLP
ncbi:MAG: deoxynucleoside kinase [Anaerolineae bacterium]|nr:MAG: deoxynucleoside kinase [Anaerolineae bacterium]